MVEGHNLGQDSSAAGEEWMEREREFMNAPLCARFISAPTASAKSPVTPIVLEKHLKEADMWFQRV